jgi:hypothetical protein
MGASEVTDSENNLPLPTHELPTPVPDALPEETFELTTPVAVSHLRRRAALIMLLLWALVAAGEVGYVIGRDRAASSPAPVRADFSPGDLSVLQVVVQSQHDRLAALQAKETDAATALTQSEQALRDAQTKPTAPAVVPIPLGSFDPLGGAAAVAYSGTLALADCTGFGDPSTCSAENHLAFTLARAADGSLTLSSALFENAPAVRTGDVLHAQGPVANATYAVACNGGTVATFFDAQLTADQVTVNNGVAAVASFSTTFTISAPPGGACPQRLQAVYKGTIAQG